MDRIIFVDDSEFETTDSVEEVLERSDGRTTLRGPMNYSDLEELSRANDPPTRELEVDPAEIEQLEQLEELDVVLEKIEDDKNAVDPASR